MSFNFGGEDDSDLDLDAFDDTGLLALASRENGGQDDVQTAEVNNKPIDESSPQLDNDGAGGESLSDGDDDGGDWDNIDWEDADSDQDDDDDGNIGNADSFPTQGIMINFGKRVGKSNDPDEGKEAKQNDVEGEQKDDGDNAKKSKKRKRVTRVLRSVPYETQQMVLNVRRSHMLSCLVHSMMQSSFACGPSNISDDSNEERELLLCMALSLIPQQFHSQQNNDNGTPQRKSASKKSKEQIPLPVNTIPTKNELQQFSQWFFQLVNEAGNRRRIALQRNFVQGAAITPTATRTRRSSSSRRNRGQQSSTKNQSANKKKGKTNNSTKEEESLIMSTSIHNFQSNHSNHSADYLSPSKMLLKRLIHLSPDYDEDPQLLLESEGIDAIDAVEQITSHEKVLLFLLMVR